MTSTVILGHGVHSEYRFFFSEFPVFSPDAAVYGHNRKLIPDFRKFFSDYPFSPSCLLESLSSNHEAGSIPLNQVIGQRRLLLPG